jgi:hypothetical protein
MVYFIIKIKFDENFIDGRANGFQIPVGVTNGFRKGNRDRNLKKILENLLVREGDHYRYWQ